VVPRVEPWRELLDAGHSDRAWTLFIDHYHRLIDATVCRLILEPDEAVDAFAHVCERLSESDFARLRRFTERSGHRAKFSTWLVAVVRNLTIDWRRARHGRPRATPPPQLTRLRQRIYQLVLVDLCSHVEAYEIIAAGGEKCSFREFLAEVKATYLHGGIDELSGETDATGESGRVTPEVAAGLTRAMATLPTDEREAIRLFVVEERPAEEVARAVGWPNAKAVYNRVRRALAAARAALSGTDVER
jgi:RNA polymerase sigma factor (sigma-70 family)